MRVFNAPQRILALASAASVFALTAAAQVDTVLPEDDESAPETERVSPEGASYPDGAGGEVYFPIGEASFADTVTEFVPGQPDATRVSARTPSGALGAPDYNENADTGYVTLGCGGVLNSARVIIEGYTNASGDADYNMDLSKRRADAVRARLEEISDRDQDTFVSVGRGETRPVAPNDSSQGAAQNRRVEILILTP